MSHLAERKEKNCLNCNAQVHGKYCHICGQENIEPKETAWHLITHFFEDITHFDGKFFATLKLLVTRPGFLPRAYMAGRRVSYLNPIRMYIFTSAVFFLIFFSVTNFDAVKKAPQKSAKEVMAKLLKREAAFVKEIEETKDIPVIDLQESLENIRADIDTLKKDSTAVPRLITTINNDGFNFATGKYKSLEQYDSTQKLLPEKNRDGWLATLFLRRTLQIKEKYKDVSVGNVLISKFMHLFPQMLFISLPLFAFLLKLLYTRRKQFYYVNHGIFSIHFYIFSFITILAIMGINSLKDRLHWEIFTWIVVALVFSIFFYLYKAMRNFYQQRRAKTVWKFILLNIAAIFVFILLFSIFFIFSFFQI